jgi:hypothetical protein
MGSHGVPDVAIDAHVPESVKRDIRLQIKRFREEGGKVRLIRIGYDDFHRTVDLVMQQQRRAFRPTLCGIPVEWSTMEAVQVIAVRKGSPVLSRDQAGRMGEVSM